MKNKGNSWPSILKRIIVLSNLVSSVGSQLFPPCFLPEVLSGFHFLSWLVQPCKWIPTTLTCQLLKITLAGQKNLEVHDCGRVSIDFSAISMVDVAYPAKLFQRLQVSQPWSPKTSKVFVSLLWSDWWQVGRGDKKICLRLWLIKNLLLHLMH